MTRKLTNQELHNLAMNIVGKDLKQRGFEFLAVNSQLKKHPQFVCIDAHKNRYFVIVKYGLIKDYPIKYDVIWMETIKSHAQKHQAKVLYAGLGIGHKTIPDIFPNLNEDYLLKYEGLQDLSVTLN
ncbi:MAG: Na(+)-translocating NADH-quinone reductase subunit F [Lutibacter sp.]